MVRISIINNEAGKKEEICDDVAGRRRLVVERRLLEKAPGLQQLLHHAQANANKIGIQSVKYTQMRLLLLRFLFSTLWHNDEDNDNAMSFVLSNFFLYLIWVLCCCFYIVFCIVFCIFLFFFFIFFCVVTRLNTNKVLLFCNI